MPWPRCTQHAPCPLLRRRCVDRDAAGEESCAAMPSRTSLGRGLDVASTPRTSKTNKRHVVSHVCSTSRPGTAVAATRIYAIKQPKPIGWGAFPVERHPGARGLPCCVGQPWGGPPSRSSRCQALAADPLVSPRDNRFIVVHELPWCLAMDQPSMVYCSWKGRALRLTSGLHHLQIMLQNDGSYCLTHKLLTKTSTEVKTLSKLILPIVPRDFHHVFGVTSRADFRP